MNKYDLQSWIEATTGKVLIAGYGSLLSSCSRQRHSNIFLPTLPCNLNGWQRGWITRSLPEQQTYVGALQHSTSVVTAQLIPTEIDPKLRMREQDYRFVRVDPLALDIPEEYVGQPRLLETLHKTPIYICESLNVVHADVSHPVNFSYIATCLAGAEEADADNGINNFLINTHHWTANHISLDLACKAYPRAAILSLQQKQKYMAALKRHRLF